MFHPLGECSVTLEGLGELPPGWNERLRAFARAVEAAGLPGLVEAAAGIHTATVFYDIGEVYRGLDRLEREFPSLKQEEPRCLQDVVCHVLEVLWDKLVETAPAPGRIIEIPVRYGGHNGPDLKETAVLCGMTEEELVSLHSSGDYRVLMLGFMPGFPYLDGLPQQLRVERLAVPRLHVPAGSVALGGGQTGIYPQAAPGGWRLIGRTSMSLFRPETEEPFLLQAGDTVRFVPV